MMEKPVRRVNYVEGQILTAADLRAEQEYHRQMRHLHNRALHGSGIVEGLEVEVTGADEVWVTPGLAIDARGREVVVGEPVCLDLRALEEEPDLPGYVLAAWEEVPDETTVQVDGSFTRWIERARLRVTAQPPDVPTDDLVLAVLVRTPEGSTGLDRSARARPAGPGHTSGSVISPQGPGPSAV